MSRLESNEDDESVINNIQLRQYQLELIRYARTKNSIIFLPTGSGKTFISLNVLKSRIKDLKITNGKSGKVAIFMGTTKLLVKQLGTIVEENTNLKVKVFLGDMGIDNWNLKTWLKEIEGFQVLCTTPAILLELLQKKVIPLGRISFIVLDECHHATLNHPYNKIMKEFDLYEEKDWPLVLGLTATVLNGNPKGDTNKEIHTLKTNMRSTFARTMLTDEAIKYGTCPKEEVISYSADDDGDAYKALSDLLDETTQALRGLRIEEPVNKRAKNIVPQDCVLLHSENETIGKLVKIMNSLKIVLDELGLYPMDLAALFYIIKLERKKFPNPNSSVPLLAKYAITVLNLIRRKIMKKMPSDLVKGCSPKVRALLNFLVGQRENRDDLTCLILVEKKITAVVLSALFNEFSKREGDDYFKSNYVTGGIFNAVSEQRESWFERDCHDRILLSFRNKEFHFLFATNVMEEGMDIHSVNLGVIFEGALLFRTYVQFKGRIRSKTGRLVTITSDDSLESAKRLIASYNRVYGELLKSVHSIENFGEAQEEEEEEEEEEIYFLNGPDGPHISGTQAIGFVIRYCSSLPQDEYSALGPLCWYSPKEKRAFLLMPSSCPIRTTIQGDIKRSRKAAKKNVYLKALKELHKAKEILDNLTIHRYKCNEEDFSELFPNSIREELPEGSPLPGTKTMKRPYEIKFAENLSRCTPQPGSPAYLHYIKFTAKDERPLDSRHAKFYDLLCSSDDFVILSSKRLTKICDFPVFSRFGEFNCSLIVNAGVVTLRASELELIRRFHFFIFNSVLGVVNRLQVLDKSNEGLSFYVVPVKHQYDKELFINWNVIKEFAPHAETTEMSELYCPNPSIDDYYESVVFPKYRKTHCAAGYYIVTSLDRTQTPLSEFPVEDFSNYCEYYDKKYQTKITNTSQPLLEVKRIFSKINYLVPKKHSTSKNRRKKLQEDDDDFREFLVPELCCRLTFPSSIWLKATFLPSALHRITSIYLIDDMRKKIASDTGLGVVEVGDDHKWQPLPVEKTLDIETPVSQFTSNYKTRQRWKMAEDGSDMQMPIDIFRRITECAPCDLKHYVNYFDSETKDSYQARVVPDKDEARPLENVPDLKLPSGIDGKTGPELSDLVKVFTCKSAMDVIDLERLEFWGDAFLKFSVSFYLLRKYRHHEGVLSGLKGNIVGNRNLYFSALSRKLEGPLIVNQFDPKSDWVPPLFTLPEEIKNQINGEKIEVEYSFEISSKEKLAGKLNPSSVKNIRDSAVKQGSEYGADESSFHWKTIADKTISDKSMADCAEALIGLYVKDFGLEGGFAILNWMNILSPEDGSYDSVVGRKWVADTKDITPVLNDEVAYEDIEEAIGYQFKNKILLLEALTHPSLLDSVTESFQRFEFFGDALIDFMVTTYIYHYCGEMSPGEMTDVRMGLVNNVTMACVTVKYNLHKHILHSSTSLLDAVNHFANYQKFRDNKIAGTMFLLYSEEGEGKFAVGTEVPKALGDVFESLIGAVYLDSGNCLQTAWEVYYRMMFSVIDEFCQNPPISPVRLLFEKCKPPPEFKYESLDGGLVMSKCKIIHNEEEKIFCGKGKNGKKAKMIAAKLALRFLDSIQAEPV